MARLVLVEDEEEGSPVRLTRATAKVDTPETNQAYLRGRNMNDSLFGSALQGLASVAQGPTFGFADEIGGAIGGAASALRGGDFRSGYRDTRDMLRGAADEQQEQNPWLTGITRFMASAPTMAIGGGGRQAMTLGGQALRAGTIGAITGGASGLGQSTAEDIGGMALDAATSAATGAAMGSASVPLARMGGSIGEQVLGRVSGTKAAQYAREKVAEALVRDTRGGKPQSSFDGPMGQILARQNRLGDEARLVDAGGQNTKQLLDTLATLPGRTKDAAEAAIRSRQAGRADRLIGAAQDSLRTGGQRLAGTIDDLVQDRAAASAPLYARLHQIEIEANPRIAASVAAAEDLGASKIAQDIARARKVPYSLSSQSQGRWSMRDLDHLKEGLDDLIEKATAPDGKLSRKGLALVELRNDLVGALDEATNGFYKNARDAFAGPSALIDSAKRGRMFFSADDADTAKVLAGMSESEREAFRVGAFEALRAKLGRPGGQTEVMGMWRDKVLGEKLRAVFPDQRAFREFAASVAKESRLKGIESVGRGSQTATRLAGMNDLDIPAAAETAATLTSGGVPGFMLGASRLMNRVQTPEPVRDAMGALLLSQGQAARGAAMGLEETLRQVHQNRMLQAAGLGLLGGNLGGGVGTSISGGLLGP